MSDLQKVFVYLTDDQKERVRSLAYKLRVSQSKILLALALPGLDKLETMAEERPDAVREMLLKRVGGVA